MKFTLSSTLAGAVFALGSGAPAQALSPVTFVSSQGANTGNCASPASPCRTFHYALGQTSAGGEIKALDPANYLPVNINKSISITGVEGAGILRTNAGNAVIVNAGPSGVVNLRGLSIDGFGVATTGIVLTTAKSLAVEKCAIRNFANSGIGAVPTSASTIVVSNTLVANNGAHGIFVQPSGGAFDVKAIFNHVEVYNNAQMGIGIYGNFFTGRVTASAVDSIVGYNGDTGYFALGGPPTFPNPIKTLF